MRARRFLPGLLPLATGLVIGAAVAVGPGLVQWVCEKISNKGTEETERPKQPEIGNKADEQSTVAPGELAEATDINCGPDPEPWTCFIIPPFFWHALSELCTYSGALCPLNPFDGSKGQVVSWSYTSLFQTTIAIVSEHDPRQVVLVTLLRGPSPCVSVVIDVLVCSFTQPSAARTEVHNAAAVAEQSQDTAHKKKKHKKNRKKLNKKQRLAKKRAAEAALASSATPVPAAVAHVPTETEVACELPAEQAEAPITDASVQTGCSDVCSNGDSLITCSTPVASSPACSRRCSEAGSACGTEEACADSMTTNSLAEQATETEGTSNHGSEDQVLGLVFTPKPESEPTVSTGPSRGGTGASSTPLSDSPASSLGRVSDNAALSDSALSVPSRPASQPESLVQETTAQQAMQAPVRPLLIKRINMLVANENPAQEGILFTGRQLGQGNWGSVEACYFLGVPAAFKQSIMVSSAQKHVYHKELDILAQIALAGGHDNLLSAIGAGWDEGLGRGAVVTPLMSCNLAEYCAQYRVGLDMRPVPQLVKLLLDVGRGLTALHNIGNTHNDLKPANVLVDVNTLVARLTDFGMSYFSQSDVPRIYPGGTKRNGAYEVNRLSVPQPEGMSPLAGHYDNRADMCAYGILIQWALTGEHSVRTSLATHCVSEATADLKSLPMLDDGLVSGKLRHTPHPDLPASLKAVLARALSTSPDDRPTLADIMTTLEQSVPDLLAAQQQKAMQRHIEALRKQQQQQQRQQMMLQQMMQQDMAVYGP